MAERVEGTFFRKLFSPVLLGRLELPNRIVMPAIHLSYTPHGLVTDRLVEFYSERAAGGAGLIIVGGCPVDELGGGPYMIGISSDEFVPGLRRLTEAMHDHGVLVAAQLYHAGRYSRSRDIGHQPLAPSAVISSLTGEKPVEMSKEDITRTVGSFADAARRASESGFDAVEISASAGYLISQFLSPVTNLRQDWYGGSFKNRLRFPLDVVGAVRTAVGPDFPIIVRVAGNDFVPGGNTNEEARLFARELENAGVDAIDVTGGWHETRVPQITMAVPRGAFSYLARGVKEIVGIPVISSNRYSDPVLAERMLRDGVADLIAMGRPLIADPDLPRKVRSGRVDEINSCVACNQGCFDSIFAARSVTCLVNPRAGREHAHRPKPATKPKRVTVIGGGPAGMQTALTAAARGHRVTLLEKSTRLGGQLNLASAAPGREELGTIILSFSSQMEKGGVEVKLGHDTGAEDVLLSNPDAVVVATGAEPMMTELPGAAALHVVQAWDVLANAVDVGHRVVVLGGGATGCMVALYLAHLGTISASTLRFLAQNRAESWETLEVLIDKGIKDVTLVERQSKFGMDIGLTTRWTILEDLRRSGVKMMKGAAAERITPQGLLVSVDGEKRLVDADTLVLAVGVLPINDLYHSLEGHVAELHVVGDARKPRRALDAIREGFETGLLI